MSTVKWVPDPKYDAIERGFLAASECVERPGAKASLRLQRTWANCCVRCLLENHVIPYNACPKAKVARSECRWHMLRLSCLAFGVCGTVIENVIRATWILEGVPGMVTHGRPSKAYKRRKRRW